MNSLQLHSADDVYGKLTVINAYGTEETCSTHDTVRFRKTVQETRAGGGARGRPQIRLSDLDSCRLTQYLCSVYKSRFDKFSGRNS